MVRLSMSWWYGLTWFFRPAQFASAGTKPASPEPTEPSTDGDDGDLVANPNRNRGVVNEEEEEDEEDDDEESEDAED